jgi:hypothetical protein
VAPAQLVALTETSLALAGTLLVTTLSTPSAPTLTVLTSSPSTTLATVNETQAQVSTAFLSVAPSQGQGLFTQGNMPETHAEEVVATEAAPTVGQGRGQDAKPPAWIRYLLGVEEDVEQIRRENQDALLGADKPAATAKPPRNDAEAPAGDGSPASRSTPPRVPGQGRTDGETTGVRLVLEAVDAVLASIGAATRFWSAEQSLQTRAEPAPVAAWAPVVLATTLVIHASPLAETLRNGNAKSRCVI